MVGGLIGLVGYVGGLMGTSGGSRDFAVAAPGGFQEFRQLFGGLWADYLVEGFVEQNPFG